MMGMKPVDKFPYRSSIVWLMGSGATHGLQRQMAMPRAYKSVLELVDFIYERENEDKTKGNTCMSLGTYKVVVQVPNTTVQTELFKGSKSCQLSDKRFLDDGGAKQEISLT
ncbi:uncharacterized protein LACBIDRAFT_328855 [Laccaria bicolor S238N-H82]|uniref:Predicted protein n=1 Tax=Laccaria bicolor (strain S238N-H82 / ATCC MYA-4686) TaxID=486041 RepID=B0DG74_LACBS|nr:uncharacterized protein LACBIDRAFT_328855 [Laccaria bicolor S238N-H82]EDR06464.1 predicted protein [Laccaria bicolor S238N-H82]|eukprot:XP_001882836.1 predicted protein [Laccaria bicolor S238N-H82]